MSRLSVVSTPAASDAADRRELGEGWELSWTPPGEYPSADRLDELSWRPATVPGTVAGALGADAASQDLDAHDWWYRVRFTAAPPAPGEEIVLILDGLATLAEVYVNGALVLESASMYDRHEVAVGDRLHDSHDNDLAICFRALGPVLAQRRKPRARWRTKLVSNGNLRFHRTMLLGRAPSFSPDAPVTGPWRPVTLERRRDLVVQDVRLRARVVEDDGLLECQATVRPVADAPLPDTLTVTVSAPDGAAVTARLPVDADNGRATGALQIPDPNLWWPHTHGQPSLYDVTIAAEGRPLHRATVGFRSLRSGPDLLRDGPALQINGVAVFARGAVWTPLDLDAPRADEASLRDILQRVVDAGMNMLRIPGIAAYESDEFYALCDALGILVWQDFMFANLDYPEQDPEFLRTVEHEARALLDRIGGRPCLAVLCGGSEVAQQVAMVGLDPGLASGPLYGELLPAVTAEAGVDAPYVPSAPWGGDLPFRTDAGVANYYGVGAYLRPLEDARRAGVRFAGECLAFANVPDDEALTELHAPGGLSVNHPAWKAGVPRDAGAGWDFDDVRDHYLKLLFDVDPVALRWTDQDRYLQLSRLVSGEVMAETFGEWRRAASTCQGALVLWLKDLVPGAGWGVLDHRGSPKVPYHHLRRALAPVAVWTTDEGLNGIDVHVANDRPEPLRARIRLALYRDFEVLVDEATHELELTGHSHVTNSAEGLLGRFVDVNWAYRFGPPAQDLVAVTLEAPADGGGAAETISQTFRFPASRPHAAQPDDALGLRGTVETGTDGRFLLRVSTRRFAYGVRVEIPGCIPADDAFGVEPGHERTIELHGTPESGPGVLTAVNLQGRIGITG